MQKRWLTLALSLILIATLVCSPVLASAAELGAEIDGTKVVFENPGLTAGDVHNWEGGDPSWVTSADGEMTVTVQPGVSGMYYRPNSPYGAYGAFGEGGVAMNLKLDFKADAAGDWGAMLLIRNDGHKSWDATNAVSLFFHKDKVVLYQAGNATPLAVLYKAVTGAYYNVEFITDDVDGGKTNVFVLITDENGNLVKNDGDESKYSMVAEGLDTASLPAAFISLYTNGAELASYGMKQGQWTYNKTTEPEGPGEGGEVTPPAPAAPGTYPSLDGINKFNFAEVGIAAPDGLDKYWSPIGGSNYTVGDMVTVTQAGTEGFFYGPCSPYGGALQTNVALALKMSFNFKEGANDFGCMLILKGDQANPTWALGRGIVMMVYPNSVALCKVENNAPVVLATYNKGLESGKNYNIEFIAKDNADGTTDAWLIIKDENGKLLTETEGSEVTLYATGITGAAGEGYVTMFGNGGVISGYSFGTGTFTEKVPETGDAPPVAALLALMSVSACAFVCMTARKRK